MSQTLSVTEGVFGAQGPARNRTWNICMGRQRPPGAQYQICTHWHDLMTINTRLILCSTSKVACPPTTARTFIEWMHPTNGVHRMNAPHEWLIPPSVLHSLLHCVLSGSSVQTLTAYNTYMHVIFNVKVLPARLNPCAHYRKCKHSFPLNPV